MERAAVKHIAELYFSVIWVVKYSTGGEPPIGVCRSEMRLQRPKYTKLDLFFLQNVHAMVDFCALIFQKLRYMRGPGGNCNGII